MFTIRRNLNSPPDGFISFRGLRLPTGSRVRSEAHSGSEGRKNYQRPVFFAGYLNGEVGLRTVITDRIF